MRQFYELFPFLENMQQAVAQIGSGEVLVENEIATQLAAQIVSIPLGISSYELSNLIPERFQGDLPTIEEIENELNKE